MDRRLTFVLTKDPWVDRGGDIRLVRLVQDVAAEAFEVDTICLSSQPERHDPRVVRVAKQPVPALQVAARSVARRRSLVHTRFDLPSLRHAIDASDSRSYAAFHSYAAESFLRSRHHGSSRLAVSTEVSEALVWGLSRGRLGRLEAPRIARDELRVAQAADAVGAYDREEVEQYAACGVDATWLDVTLPGADPLPIASSERRLVFLGDRTWSPNAEAAEILLRWWPRIAEGIQGAELCFVGKRPETAPAAPLPDGVRDLGFVDDLEGFLATCRALVAPIRTGGGVRVKVLEALSVGLPVVTTSVGLGSLADLLDLDGHDTEEAFVERARHLLLDRAAAATEGTRLAERNRARWDAGEPQKTILSWLGAA